MLLYKTTGGAIVKERGIACLVPEKDWDSLINRDDIFQFLREIWEQARITTQAVDFDERTIEAPIGRQEVWAAGVTYYRSRDARMAESERAGGGNFYDRVYTAERPELFFKANPHNVVGPRQEVHIRRDSLWNVPEPELTLAITSTGKIVGYTIGNDMSSRDIEGENPLYLPQAKVYDRSCALGPGILVREEPLPNTTEICMEIVRGGEIVFKGSTKLSEMKRTPQSLVQYLYRENKFPAGCFLMTGTGIVPPDTFTLQIGDEIRITIEPIGTLIDTVA
ncbi:MAG: fumarylacetoacetate hydrolase family protein [bacterium]